MILFSKALLGLARKTYEPIFSKLAIARVTITKPENYSSPDSDFSIIEAQATSVSGSRYIYIYPKDEFKSLFLSESVVIKSDNVSLPLIQYSSTYNRFAIGSLRDIPSGIYNIYVYNNATQQTIYEIKLIWTNNI